MKDSTRWILLIPVEVGVFVLAVVIGQVIGSAIGLWGEPVSGFCAATSAVAAAYVLAPRRKLAAASVVLLLGAGVAWFLIDPPSFYPESYGPKAYSETNLPVYVTYAGGVLAWLTCLVWQVRSLRNA